MAKSRSKWKERGSQVVLNAARYLIIPVANMVVAWLVIHFNTAEIWGSFT